MCEWFHLAENPIFTGKNPNGKFLTSRYANASSHEHTGISARNSRSPNINTNFLCPAVSVSRKHVCALFRAAPYTWKACPLKNSAQCPSTPSLKFISAMMPTNYSTILPPPVCGALLELVGSCSVKCFCIRKCQFVKTEIFHRSQFRLISCFKRIVEKKLQKCQSKVLVWNNLLFQNSIYCKKKNLNNFKRSKINSKQSESIKRKHFY